MAEKNEMPITCLTIQFQTLAYYAYKMQLNAYALLSAARYDILRIREVHAPKSLLAG